MKVFVAPDKTKDREWKLNDFYFNEKWRNILTNDQLLELDIIPMGGEVEVRGIVGKPIIIIRIL